MNATPVLPDLLQSGLRLVFCGTAAGTASARAQAYYAGPGNSFWETVFAVGLAPERLRPADFRRLPEFRIGLTDVCKLLHGSDQSIGSSGFDVEGLRQRIEAAAPAHLAFNGKKAAQVSLDRKVEYGLQDDRFGQTSLWVLPSTSGAARGYWDIKPWQDLANAVLGSRT